MWPCSQLSSLTSQLISSTQRCTIFLTPMLPQTGIRWPDIVVHPCTPPSPQNYTPLSRRDVVQRDVGCPLDWQFTKKSWTLSDIKLVILSAKSTFYSVEVSASSTVKKLYKVTSILLGKITSTHCPLPTPLINFHRSFLTFLSARFAKSVYPLTSRLFTPLCTVLGGVISLVHPCVDLRVSPMELCWSSFLWYTLVWISESHQWNCVKFISQVHPCVDFRESPMKLCEVHFSGTPLCGFERVTNGTMLKFISLVHPCMDLRESPMKLCWSSFLWYTLVWIWESHQWNCVEVHETNVS